jgi:hypothetical protein
MTQRERKPNRRDTNRRTSYIIVTYKVKEGVFRDILKNIGANGIFIKTQRLVAEGQSIELEFPLFQFEEPIKAKGTVVRSSRMGFAVEFEQPLPGLAGGDGGFADIVHESDRLE